jgi:hypothetical protein
MTATQDPDQNSQNEDWRDAFSIPLGREAGDHPEGYPESHPDGHEPIRIVDAADKEGCAVQAAFLCVAVAVIGLAGMWALVQAIIDRLF